MKRSKHRSSEPDCHPPKLLIQPYHVLAVKMMLIPSFSFEEFRILGHITGKTVPDFLQDLSGAALGAGWGWETF